MLFECAAESYLPLLQVFDRLVEEGVSPKATMGITPVLAEQLSHPDFKQQFADYLLNRAEAAEEDRRQFEEQNEAHFLALAHTWREHFLATHRAFTERYQSDLVGAFRRLSQGGHIEIITSAATHGYLPLIGTDQSLQAQVKQAVSAHRRHFGRPPSGFWLPECGYRPRYRWRSPLPEAGPQEPLPRKGVEEFLAESGLRYFIVDTATLMGGSATGVYLERFAGLQQLWEQFRASYRPGPVDIERSPYQTYLVSSAVEDTPPVAVFTRDERTGLQVWSYDIGYPGDGWYLDFHKKQFPGGHRYWRVTGTKLDLMAKEPYLPERARERIPENAGHFSQLVRELVRENHARRGTFPIVCAPYDAELFGHWWFEGPEWLYQVLKGIAADPDVQLMTCSEYLETVTPEAAVALPESSWGQGGFHWVWLNEWTSWIWKAIYAAEAEMPELAKRALASTNPLLGRISAQAARELLLLEASDWPFLVSTWSARDYAERRAALHSEAFTRLAEMSRRPARGEELSGEEQEFLSQCERTDDLFPDIDVAWWAGVDHPARG
jgi:1,4-alpha-glucan branching enzyme